MVIDPNNPLDALIRFLVMLFTGFLLFFGTRQDAGSPPPAGDTFKSMTVIENAQALVLESFPAQISLTVKGYHPEGCDFPVQVEQTREGNHVTVQIYREVPLTVVCPMILNPYEANIHLDGTFESGTYTIDINGTVIEVKI
jgi:hypothetical protein